MHKKKKIILVLVLFVLMIMSFSCHKKTAYAAEVTLEFPDTWYASGVDASQYDGYLASLKSNPNFTLYDSGLVAFYTGSGSDVYVCIVEPLQEYSYEYGMFGTYQKWVMGYYSSFTTTSNLLSSVSFSRTLQDVPAPSSGNDGNAIGFSYQGSMGSSTYSLFYGNSYYYQGSPRISGRTTSAVYKFDNNYIPPSDTLYGLDLGINETDFRQWIIDNNKISDLPAYIGTSKLASFIHFYNTFGSNRSNFLLNIIQITISYFSR